MRLRHRHDVDPGAGGGKGEELALREVGGPGVHAIDHPGSVQ